MSEQEGIQLTPGGEKKLGNLVNLKDYTIADAIRERGGGQGQVNQLRSDYQNLKVGELANLAAEGDADAETAIKILKQARKKREKYGNR
ncbi:hypothetical protein [Argonema galeatum]|uniref:hypothetical protein n=1 Tax=Argonema galeatum TaxID=2942762 RepID=UPI0020138467|nr:hypothetical protein [Argonema galeatum]MCL1468704.1 hypothetical protein [Argonema galeatum A003/A1]